MAIISDSHLGDIVVRRNRNTRSFRATLAPNGSLRISVPSLMPLFMVKRQIIASRKELLGLMAQHPFTTYSNGMQLGKSHSLRIRVGDRLQISTHGQELLVTIPYESYPAISLANELRPHVIKLLRKEAKHYLPKRLSYLAKQHGFDYKSVRFSHASGRWGSCSAEKTISLNIALMNLPFELIDYVLIHELAHTKQLNHSPQFWAIVERSDPDYKNHRRIIKKHSPSV